MSQKQENRKVEAPAAETARNENERAETAKKQGTEKYSGKRGKKNSAGRRGETLLEERRHLLTPKSNFFVREAYKTLRTNVSFALAGEEGCHVIMVTSGMQGEGKSITAVNLAISYAMADRKVLIIDCDLRRPKLSRLLRMSSQVGLSNLILKAGLRDEAIHPTHVKGLDAILAGDIPPNPSELLGSARMEKILSELREEYEFIILDSPPVNMVTDAVVLAPRSDGVLFLVRANRSERGAVLHAVDQLEYAKAKILGFVLNGVNMEKTPYGYGKYRYKRYKNYRRSGYGGYGYGGYGYGGYGYGGYGYGGYGYGYSYNGYGYGNNPAQNPEIAETAEEEG